jgi:hypothetical protein
MTTNNNLPAVPTPSQMPSAWGSSSQGVTNRQLAASNVRLKHGMFASVPIICKGRDCPYFQTCYIPEHDLQLGERCPIEIGTIIERFDSYCDALAIDPESKLDMVDAGIVKEIVDIEIMMMRADGLLAVSGNFIEEVIAIVSTKGQEYYAPQLHKAVEFKDSLRDRKMKLLNQLNATRKDKRSDQLSRNDPSSVAARIIAKVKELEKQGKIIDVSPNEIVDEIIDEIVEEVRAPVTPVQDIDNPELLE